MKRTVAGNRAVAHDDRHFEPAPANDLGVERELDLFELAPARLADPLENESVREPGKASSDRIRLLCPEL